ncbi:MAG: carbohydrate ABC transporter permease [Anaerolineales bacterium]|nr:carbohydrate ABC transporter permease [Anaerolineales bacterium]
MSKTTSTRSGSAPGWLRNLGAYVILIAYTLLALFPVILVIMNSFKSRRAIFTSPLAPPTPETFSLVGYATVFARTNFGWYFVNSLIVTLVSMVLILFLGAMAAWALSGYNFRGSTIVGLYMALGIMIPIRLGTVSILKVMVALGLVNTLWSLILVYTAMGLPLTVFVLQQFMRQVPRELTDAARIDGASEYRIFGLVVPLVRPAVATVAVFTMIPVWNDLWFPLILAPGESTKTVTLGAQQFLGQFVSDWNAVLSALTLAMVPILILYILFSRQLIRGLTAGAIK